MPTNFEYAIQSGKFAGLPRLVNIEHEVATLTGIACNAMDSRFAGGAKGDGSDDTVALNAAANVAVNAAAGTGITPTLILPKPSVYYRVTGPITIQATSQPAFTALNILGPGGSAPTILYDGPSSASLFKSLHWAYSSVEGVNVTVPAGKTGVVVWDYDATTGSGSHVSWRRCNISLASAGNDCIGWRMGHLATAGGMDELEWQTCAIAGNASATGQYGWVNEQPNGLQYVWIDSGGDHLAKMFTNLSTSGAQNVAGGDGMWFYSAGGSFNAIDFEFVTGGMYGVYGGRFESGTSLLKVGGGSTALAIELSAEIANYAAGKVLWINGRPVTLDAFVFAYGTDHTAEFLTALGSSPQVGQIKLRGAVRGADPCCSISNDPWAVDIQLQKLDSINQPTTFFNGYTKTIASATTITLPPMDGMFTISGTTTITSVTAGRADQRVTLLFSGALTFTDGSNLKLAGNFVTTADDTITLVCDGTNWFETSRSVN